MTPKRPDTTQKTPGTTLIAAAIAVVGSSRAGRWEALK